MFYTSEHTRCVEDDSERDPTNHADMTGNHTYAHETRAHADSRQTCTAICSGPSRALPRKVCLRHDLFDIYFTAKTDMEPRQGGRFHIWHMLTRGDAFLQPMRSRKTVLSRRELRTTPLRSMAPCAKVFTSYAGEFDNNVSYMPGQIEQCIIV